MSLSIVRIRQKAESLVRTGLGRPYERLPYQYDLEANDDQSLIAGYAVTIGEGSQVYNQVSQVVNMEQTIHVSLTKRAFVRNDDEKVTETLDDLYEIVDGLIKTFCMDKLGLRDIIQQVQLKSMPEPEILGNGRDIVVLKLEFNLRYLII